MIPAELDVVPSVLGESKPDEAVLGESKPDEVLDLPLILDAEGAPVILPQEPLSSVSNIDAEESDESDDVPEPEPIPDEVTPTHSEIIENPELNNLQGEQTRLEAPVLE